MMRWQFQVGMMLLEANLVISMRVMGMAGLWRVAPSESTRMVSEKIAAASEGTVAAARAVQRGAKPVSVLDAALRPTRRRTAANVKRLAKRGPGKPS